MLSLGALAQTDLSFDKRFVQSEDKWVAFRPDSIGNHNFGFIYIDQQAGLTFDYYGSFKIDQNGAFDVKKKEVSGSMKYRLEPNNVLVAHIPENKFSELGIEKTPEWLKYYKKDEETAQRQYRWGYLYNGWGECQKALEHLNKAYEIDPKYKGLKVELAYSYNCLKNYEKAIEYLMLSVKEEAVTAYTIKELIYAQAQKGDVIDAENTFNLYDPRISDKTYRAENAFNILQGYYKKNDVDNFNRWLKESKLKREKRFKVYVEQMIVNLN